MWRPFGMQWVVLSQSVFFWGMGKWVRIYSLAIIPLQVLVQNGCWATCFALLMDRSCWWLDIGANVPEINNKWRCFRYHNWCRNLVCPSTICDVRFFENDPADAELSNKFGCIITGISTVRWQKRVSDICFGVEWPFSLTGSLATFTSRKKYCKIACLHVYLYPESSQHFYHYINVGVETVSKSQVAFFFLLGIFQSYIYNHINIWTNSSIQNHILGSLPDFCQAG